MASTHTHPQHACDLCSYATGQLSTGRHTGGVATQAAAAMCVLCWHQRRSQRTPSSKPTQAMLTRHTQESAGATQWVLYLLYTMCPRTSRMHKATNPDTTAAAGEPDNAAIRQARHRRELLEQSTDFTALTIWVPTAAHGVPPGQLSSHALGCRHSLPAQ